MAWIISVDLEVPLLRMFCYVSRLVRVRSLQTRNDMIEFVGGYCHDLVLRIVSIIIT